MTESRCIHSQELLLLSLLLVLLATGILNDLPGLTSCCCDNIGLVLLILFGSMCTKRHDLVFMPCLSNYYCILRVSPFFISLTVPLQCIWFIFFFTKPAFTPHLGGIEKGRVSSPLSVSTSNCCKNHELSIVCTLQIQLTF